jgi:hypothetical protein
MSTREERGKAQYEITQKRIDAMAAWLDEIFPETRDRLIQDIMNVYTEMLSTLGDKKKSAPADLYKLDSYWELQKNARESLQALGEEINAQINEQLHMVYVEVYEGCRPGEERVCEVSERAIQKAIDKSRGKAERNSHERIWMNMTVLWDKLFGELMHCTIKHFPAKNLLARLENHFNTTIVALKTAFSDSTTFVQVRAVGRRNKDEREAQAAIALANLSGEEGTAVPMMMSARDIFGDEGDFGEGELDDESDDEEEEENNRFIITVEWDDLVCEPCMDLDGTLWDEDKWGDVPVPVHPNCRCWVDEAPPNPFDEAADAVSRGGLLGVLLAGVLTIAGMMWDDFLSGGLDPGSWLAKWGDQYPV